MTPPIEAPASAASSQGHAAALAGWRPRRADVVMASGIGPAVEASLVSTHARAQASRLAPRSTTDGRSSARATATSATSATQQRSCNAPTATSWRVLMYRVAPRTQSHPDVPAGQEPGVSRCRGPGGPRDTRVILHAPDQPSSSAAKRSAASRPMPGCTCWYTVSVMVALAWPRRSETTFTGTPSASSRVAWIRRRPSSRIPGSRSSPRLPVHRPPARWAHPPAVPVAHEIVQRGHGVQWIDRRSTGAPAR
jgi:hypothetical protein